MMRTVSQNTCDLSSTAAHTATQYIHAAARLWKAKWFIQYIPQKCHSILKVNKLVSSIICMYNYYNTGTQTCKQGHIHVGKCILYGHTQVLALHNHVTVTCMHHR